MFHATGEPICPRLDSRDSDEDSSNSISPSKVGIPSFHLFRPSSSSTCQILNEQIVLTTPSAQSVRLVVALAETRCTLRYRTVSIRTAYVVQTSSVFDMKYNIATLSEMATKNRSKTGLAGRRSIEPSRLRVTYSS